MGTVNPEVFDQYFRRADLDGDGQISGREAVAFFQGANLPQATLAKIWQFADQGHRGSLSRTDFYNALKLVTVAQTGRELTYEIVRAALAGPAAAQIPPPKIVMTPVPPGSSTPQAQAPPPSRYGPAVPLQPGVNAAVRPGPGPVRPETGNLPLDGGRPAGPGSFAGPPRPPGAGLGMFTTEGHRPGSFGADSWTSGKQPASGPATVAGPPGQTPGSRNSVNTSGSFGKLVPPAGDAFGGSGFKVTPPSSTGSVDSSFGLEALSAPPPKPVAPSSTIQQAAIDPGIFEDSVFQATDLSLVPTTTATPPPATSVGVTPSTTRPPDVNPNFAGPAPASAPGAPAPAAGGPWPKMTQADKARYSKVFAEVDKDRDGKISGSEARDLFLSWQLPREVLWQVWDLSDQDGDSMLSLREFCTALYLLERFREGRPLVLPPGFHVDDAPADEWQSIAASRIAEAEAAMKEHSAGYNVPIWTQVPGLLQPPVAGAPAVSVAVATPPRPGAPPSGGGEADASGKYKSRVPVLEPHLVAQLNRDEQEMLKTKQQDAEVADKKVFELDKEIMDSKEKIEFYKTKLQEIILFKTRCDNRLAEVTERSASEKREVEILSKKYDEKFKQAGESNSRLQMEEAVFRDLQRRKMDLYNAIAKMEQGADGNVLLQSQANRISDDLDELRKAFNERGKRLGLKVKAAVTAEPPFGWQPGLQESAAQWDEDWDKFNDEGFTPVEDGPSSEALEKEVDSSNSQVVVPSNSVRAPINWDEASFFDDGFEFPSDSKVPENGPGVSAKLSLTPESVKAESEDGSPRSPAEGSLFTNERFDGEPAEKEVTESSTPRFVDALSNSPLDSRAAPSELQPDTRSALSDSPLDGRAMHISSPRGDHGNGHAMSDDFSGSFTSFASSRETGDRSGLFSNSASGIFGAPSLFSDSPKSYARTDTSRETLVRFDSFSSMKDAPRRRFESFDDDPFAGTGPFSAGAGQGGKATKASLDWSAF